MTFAEARKIKHSAATEMRLAVHYAWLTHFEDHGMSRSAAHRVALDKVMEGSIPPPQKVESVQ